MKNDKMSKEEIQKRWNKDAVSSFYEHGGSRIYINGESGNRQLLVDTYYDNEFALYIAECARKYFDSK